MMKELLEKRPHSPKEAINMKVIQLELDDDAAEQMVKDTPPSRKFAEYWGAVVGSWMTALQQPKTALDRPREPCPEPEI